MPNLDGTPTPRELALMAQRAQLLPPFDPNRPVAPVVPPPAENPPFDPASVAPVVPVPTDVAVMEQQRAEAAQHAAPAGIGEKLLQGFLGLPGIRQTAGRVAAPFFNDHEEAAKQELELTKKIDAQKQITSAQQGDVTAAVSFLHEHNPKALLDALTLKDPRAQGEMILKQVGLYKEGIDLASKEQETKLAPKRFNLSARSQSEEERRNAASELLAWKSLDAKKAEAASKGDTKAEAALDRLREQISGIAARGAQSMMSKSVWRGMLGKLLENAIDASKLPDTDPKKIIANKSVVMEWMRNYDSLISAGGSSAEFAKAMLDQTGYRTVQELKTYIDANPRAIYSNPQIRNLTAQIINERQTFANEIGAMAATAYQGMGRQYGPEYGKETRDLLKTRFGKDPIMWKPIEAALAEVDANDAGPKPPTDAEIDKMSAPELKKYLGE